MSNINNTTAKRLRIITTVVFFFAAIASGWFLFNLPHDLVYKGGMTDSDNSSQIYHTLYWVVGIAFVFAFAAIYSTRIAQDQVIVYLEKKSSEAQQQNTSTASESNESLNIHSLQEKIKTGSAEERWQNALNEICAQLNAGQGALYLANDNKTIELKHGYGLITNEDNKSVSFNWGEGLIGHAAASGNGLYIDELPEGYASYIQSGLGSALPKFLFIFPIKKENESIGVIEVATFGNLSETLRKQTQEAVTILSEIR